MKTVLQSLLLVRLAKSVLLIQLYTLTLPPCSAVYRRPCLIILLCAMNSLSVRLYRIKEMGFQGAEVPPWESPEHLISAFL